MKTQLVLLGSGTPNADPEHSGPAVAVVVGEAVYLVDAGPGIVRPAAAAAGRNLPALSPDRLGCVFLTHLHSDHTAGFPDLLLSPWVLGRERPLEVHGPRGSCAMVDHIVNAYQADIQERLQGRQPATANGWQAEVCEIAPGRVYEDSFVRVDAVAVSHGHLPSFGYKFTSDDRTVVISGDTAPTPALTEAARGCDLLLHEVYSGRGFTEHDPEWQEYHAAVHTSAFELGEIAREARPTLLVLYHQLYWGSSDEELLDEVRSRYDGEVKSGVDLEVY